MSQGIFVHIGLESTGTTYIQSFFSLNRKEIQKYGIYYPEMDHLNHSQLTIFSLEDLSKNYDLLFPKGLSRHTPAVNIKNKIESAFLAEMYGLPGNTKTIIISDEHLSSRLKLEAEISRLKSLLEKVSGHIKIVVYLRRQDAHILSQYSTYVKSGGTRSFHNFYSDEKNHYNYFTLLRKWALVFGKENLIVRIYDLNKFPKESVIYDFFEIVNVSDESKFVFPPKSNESLDAKSLNFLRTLNKYWPPFLNDKPNTDRNHIIEILTSVSKTKQRFRNPEFLNQFYSLFTESNNLVAMEYFNREHLFDNTDYESLNPGEYTDYEFCVDDAFEVFSKILAGCIAKYNRTDSEMQLLNDQLHNKKAELSKIFSSASWRMTRPFRLMMDLSHRFKNSFNTKNIDEIFKGREAIEALERHNRLSDSINSKNEEKEGSLNGPTSVLFIGNDAMLAGAQVIFLTIIKWFSENTGFRIKLILLREGFLLEQFKKNSAVLVWQDLVDEYPDAGERKNILSKFAGKVDLIYGNTIPSSAIYDELEFLNAAYITHVHELEKSIRMYVSKDAILKMRLFTDGFIACSENVSANLEKNHKIAKSKLVTVQSFVEERKITDTGAKDDLRKKLNLVSEKLIVVGCGTIYWRKGVDLFIDTALVLKQNNFDNVHFYWIGENLWDNDRDFNKFGSWESLEEKIKNTGLSGNITFLGVRTNVFDYLQACDVFYLPSREDPFPLVCLEAAQCGLPVVCFAEAGDIPGFVEEDAGFIVPYEDVNAAAEKIRYLHEHPDILTRLGNTAREKFLSRHSAGSSLPKIFSYCIKTGRLKPTVSVIVPNYNCEKFLKIRIDSILHQNFMDYEIILLDDASDDKSLEIAEQYSGYPNITLHKNEYNGGNPFLQWYKGFQKAKGEILWFAEADDFCEPDFLQKLVPAFSNPSVALAYCNSFVVDENGNITGDYSTYLDKLDVAHWKTSYIASAQEEVNYGLGVKNSIPNASAVLVRKDCVTEEVFKDTLNFKFSGDWFFYLNIIKGREVVFCSEKLNYHRKHFKTATAKFNSEKSLNPVVLHEAALVHAKILETYFIHHEFPLKWENYIDEQIPAFYPGVLKEEFDRYYPYSSTKENIKAAVIKSQNRKKLVFLTTNDGSSNGGSEQLWRTAAIECRKRGHDVMVVIKNWIPRPIFISDLKNAGIHVTFKGAGQFEQVYRFHPGLIIFSLGDQDEGIEWFEFCKLNTISYIIVNHLTKEPDYWPVRKEINKQVQRGYLGAKTVLFTGNNNYRVMEKRLECKIPGAGIFYNPFDVNRDTNLPFPSMDDGLNIAIPANLNRIHKGQHLAIELFNLRKWRDRPVHLNIYGAGIDEEFLKQQAASFKLGNVTFHGHCDDILKIWKNNHALMLPSFMEGLPLVLVSAMMCSRIPILTDVGSHSEVVDDNLNGFIAKKPTVESLDEALERAYQQIEKWEEIGRKARIKILSILPEDPVDDFISKIMPYTVK